MHIMLIIVHGILRVIVLTIVEVNKRITLIVWGMLLQMYMVGAEDY